MASLDDIADAWERKLDEFVHGDAQALHVEVDSTSGPILAKAMRQCMATRPGDQSFFVLCAPAGGEPSWDLRTEELALQIAALREACTAQDLVLPSLDEDALLDGRAVAGMSRFATLLQRLAERTSWHERPFVVVLAPLGAPSNDRAWSADITTLLSAVKRTRRLRLVVMEPGPSTTATAFAQLPSLYTRVLIPESALRQRTTDLLWARANAPVGASGPRASGAAGPRVAPPVRPAEARRREALRAMSPESLGRREAVAAEGRAFARAAALASEGRLAEASAAQGLVVELAEKHAGPAEACVHRAIQLLYLAGANAPAAARALGVRTLATATELGEERAVQLTLTGLAVNETLDSQPRRAADYYRLLATHGVRSGQPLVAIDALRSCGDSLVAAGAEDQAVAAWREAIELAQSLSDLPPQISAASQLARRVADVCRRHGLTARAAEFIAIACALETGGEAGRGAE